MKEHQRKSEAYIKSFNLGWRKNENFEKNYDKIFRKHKMPNNQVGGDCLKDIHEWKLV